MLDHCHHEAQQNARQHGGRRCWPDPLDQTAERSHGRGEQDQHRRQHEGANGRRKLGTPVVEAISAAPGVDQAAMIGMR